MYPQICVSSRIDGDLCVEIRHNEFHSEELYCGCNQTDFHHWINLAVATNKELPLCVEGDVAKLSGYLYTIRDIEEDGQRVVLGRFFKTSEEVTNPFYNRKVYETVGKDTTVSFRAYNI